MLQTTKKQFVFTKYCYKLQKNNLYLQNIVTNFVESLCRYKKSIQLFFLRFFKLI